MGEVIVITSGKGGVGKTTTTANIGIGLSQLQKKVVVIDTDLGLRNLDVVMGLENRIVYNLVDVIEGGCRLKQALIKDKRFPELYLLPSAQTKDKTAVSPEQMKKLIEELKTEFDYILLDCPAGIEQGFQNAIAGADRGIVVTTPEVSAIRDADRIIGLLEAHGIKNNDLIINRLRIDMVKRGDMMSVEDVTEILAIHLLGVIPDDEYNFYTPFRVGFSGRKFRLLTLEDQKDCSRNSEICSKRIRRGRYECTICSHCERQTPEFAHCGSAYVYTRYV